MTEKNMAKADFYTSIVLIAFGITATVLALQMPGVYSKEQSPYSAPGVLPTFLGLIIAGLGLVMCLRSLRRAKGRVGVSGAAFKEFFRDNTTLRIIATIVICLCYVFLLGIVWYPLLTFFFIFGFTFFFEYDKKQPFGAQIKKIIVAAIVALVSAVVVTMVFEYLFLVSLP